MKVLILSCSTGEGHNSAAQAIYKEFKAENDEVIKKDFLSLYKKRKPLIRSNNTKFRRWNNNKNL